MNAPHHDDLTDESLAKAFHGKHMKGMRRKRIQSLLLVSPLLFFILLFFITPIGYVLYKSFYNPTISKIAPQVSAKMKSWEDISVLPSDEAFEILAFELQTMAKERLSGKFAEEVNRRVSQTGSVIKRTARVLKEEDLSQVKDFKQLLIEQHEKWGQVEIWHGIRAASQSISAVYYANALDYEVLATGEIVPQPEELRVYIPILKRTLYIALLVTVLTLLLAYPLSYYLSSLSVARANILLIFVLLPFWTSLLVRTTSWIVILQADGVVNKVLLTLGIIEEPLEIIYNQFSTVLAMTHILLPFMILPLFSVMRGIDASYIKASKSLGGNAFMSFVKVYFPLSVPGVSAGALLVFILAVGYYITPALVGGVDGQLISNLIAHHMRSTNNWELAAALASVLLFLVSIMYWVYDRYVGVSNLKL